MQQTVLLPDDPIATACQRGRDARTCGEPEPHCPYQPGTPEYKAFAAGFCENLPDVREWV